MGGDFRLVVPALLIFGSSNIQCSADSRTLKRNEKIVYVDWNERGGCLRRKKCRLKVAEAQNLKVFLSIGLYSPSQPPRKNLIPKISI